MIQTLPGGRHSKKWSAENFGGGSGPFEGDGGPRPAARAQRTPLHLAVLGGDLDTVKLLLGLGAATAPRDLHGMTSLHWAAEKGHALASWFLLGLGAPAGPGR
jgi:hypothetical protein